MHQAADWNMSSRPPAPSLRQMQADEDREGLDSIEITSELDDALNELGMLSSSSGTAIGSEVGLNRKEFLKDKWRRGRYPLRREKEREICWSSSSSSGSCCSSSGSSSRRSSSSSAGSGSFSSLRSCYTSRSPLLSSYSIAETPTGGTPAVFSTSAQCSSRSSSFADNEMRMQEVVTTCIRSVDVVKVLRRRGLRQSPYNRRCSLNLAFGKCDQSQPQQQRPSSSSSGFYSGDNNNLILRGGLSDSEASSGSGTGTPPPTHLPLCSRPTSFTTAFFKTFTESGKSAIQTKSNPTSPEKANYDMKLADDESHLLYNSSCSKEPVTRVPGGGCHSTVRAAVTACPFASTTHILHSGPMSRSKSLDDLTSLAFVSEDSSSSTDFAAGPHPYLQTPSDAYHLHLMQQQQQTPDPSFLRCCHAPVHHHSHHQLQSQANSEHQAIRSSAGHSVLTRDSAIYDNVVHRMNQLEMN